MSNPWFRFYSDFIFDEKIEFIAFEDQRHYVFVLCMKNMGLLDKEYPQPDMLERVVAKRLGLYGEAFTAAKKRLMDVGLIDFDWNPIGWDKRQFISDADPTNAERQRRYRERKKAGSDSNAPRNVTVTPLDTEADTETETEKKKTKSTAVDQPDGVSDFVWADFKKLRTAKKAPITKTALDGIAREAAKAGVTLEKALQTCCERGWTGFKADWVAEQPQVQRGPAFPNQTVPSKNTPDPALEKIKADEAVVKPPPPEIRAKLELLKRGGLSAFRG